MRHLIVGTGGIGSAVAEALKGEVITLSRSADGLDVTDEASVKAAFEKLDGAFDTVFCAVGALAPDGHEPEKSISAFTADALAALHAVNCIGPAMVLKHTLRLLPKDRRAVFAALSARVGSIGDNAIGGWHSYRSSKAALNQIVHGAAIELRRTHPQAICVALHPGTVATPFTAKYAGRHKTVPPEEAAANLLSVLDNLTPEQSGGFYDYAGEEIPW